MSQTKENIHIKVFVTSTLKFRARIRGPGETPYEVTVGGDSWKSGKGREHTAQIMDKIKHIISALNRNHQEILRELAGLETV